MWVTDIEFIDNKFLLGIQEIQDNNSVNDEVNQINNDDNMVCWFLHNKTLYAYSYQDQEAVVADDLPPPILHPAPYLPAGQPFIEANIEYNDLNILAVICSYCHALHFDCEKLRSSWVNHSKFGMCCLQGQCKNLVVIT